MEKHFLQFVDPDGQIHELQVPTRLENVRSVGVTMFGGKYVLMYHLDDGTTPMIAMPDDYSPEKNWRCGGYRRDPERPKPVAL